MAEGRMGMTSRLICECVSDHPDLTANEVAREIDANTETVKKLVCTLVERGYLKRGRRTAVGYRIKLGAKPFPSSESYKQRPDWLREVQAERDRKRVVNVVVPAMYAMVLAGREAA